MVFRFHGFVALVLLGVLLSAPSAYAEATFERVGSWSNVRISEGEDSHAYGFQLDLWMNDGEPMGTLMYYSGPVADAPIGELEAIELDRKSGELRFKTKMSIGAIRGEEPGSWVPSHDVFTFEGRIEDEDLSGTLIQRVMNTDPPATNHQEVTLRPTALDDMAPAYDSFDQWRDWLDEALKSRGPKDRDS